MAEEEKGAKLRHWADKLAVESEPGLTTAQLMVRSLLPTCTVPSKMQSRAR